MMFEKKQWYLDQQQNGAVNNLEKKIYDDV